MLQGFRQIKNSRILYLSLGLCRVHLARERTRMNETAEKLIEPKGARVCRRNILALAAIVVVASVAGADPRDLNIFGVKPPDDWGVLVLGAAAILAHLYWYVLRYHHLRDDGRIDQLPISGEIKGDLKINSNNSFILVYRSADLVSNRTAFALTLLSWWCIGSWIIS